MAELPKGIKNLIEAFERLPGIGPKGATRLAFYLLNTPKAYVQDLATALVKMKDDIKICRECFSVTEQDICSICKDKQRDIRQICVVERAIDVMAIENMGGYKGIYHVLGGVINPLEHVGPEDLKIDELIERVKNKLNGKNECLEVILATNPTMEGEATALYIKKKLEGLGVKISRIGSGLPIGADLEYADQATLCRALDGRKDI
ncbi:MAG TPA: recombination mediator RecR [Candidatus Woesebacteria bacterium]|jgi:recombination protein RecR|nr:recombination protein RecR [Candidatus Shapirobacteria bacterium]HOR02040.1 recombination mediator RecR [Candidatus Woesebacteria bacterium]